MKPPECLYAYDKDENILKKDKKKKLLSEQRKASFESGDSPFALHAIYLLLTHPEKGAYIVQRADKREDPDLWSMTVGGHVSADEPPDDTVVRETKEELNMRLVLASIDDCVRQAREQPLMEYAIAHKVAFIPWLGTYRLDRPTKDHWLKRTHAHLYAGVFRGSPVIGPEARAVKIYTKDDLRHGLSEHNRLFSDTLRVFVERYPAILGNV